MSRAELQRLAARFSADAAPIARFRNVTLVQIAGRLRWEGHDAPTLRYVLHQINSTCCAPPLSWLEVERIVKNIARKPAGNGAGAASREAFERCRAHVTELHSLSLSIPWPGRSASTDLAVLHALHGIAAECGRSEVQASLRQLAERAGVESFRTVARAAERLGRRGWVKRVRRGGYSIKNRLTNEPTPTTTPTVWRLTRPRSLLQTGHTNAASCAGLNVLSCNRGGASDASLNVLSCTAVTADAWRRGGLGLTARRIWQALSTDRAVTAGDLTKQLGCHRSTVTRLLSGKLKSYVVREAGGWRRNGQDPPLTFTRTQRQQREHAHDRERFADVIDSLRHRRRGGRLVLSDPLPRAVPWLVVTVQTATARKVAAWLIAVRAAPATTERAARCGLVR